MNPKIDSQRMPRIQTSSGFGEIKRLQKKLNESIEKDEFFNALFTLGLLNIQIQKRLGTLRFLERDEKVKK